jgi:hypothetical protein
LRHHVESSQLGSRRAECLRKVPRDRAQREGVRGGFSVDEGADWIQIFDFIVVVLTFDNLKLEQRALLRSSESWSASHKKASTKLTAGTFC